MGSKTDGAVSFTDSNEGEAVHRRRSPELRPGAACSRIGLSGEVASPKARGRISLLFITPLLSPSVELPKGFTWAKNVLAVELNRV